MRTQRVSTQNEKKNEGITSGDWEENAKYETR